MTFGRAHSHVILNRLRAVLFGWLASVFCFSTSAQIKQAWVSKYNNGIANGNHQGLKMALVASGGAFTDFIVVASNSRGF